MGHNDTCYSTKDPEYLVNISFLFPILKFKIKTSAMREAGSACVMCGLKGGCLL